MKGLCIGAFCFYQQQQSGDRYVMLEAGINKEIDNAL